jgi:hypothetical protein
MAKRAVLLDRDNECVAHVTYAEIDDYMARGLVERLTPVKAKTHVFRLIDKKAQYDAEIVDLMGFDESSLSATTSMANAGTSTPEANLWARRRVRIWPFIGDTRAPRVACRV